MLNKSAEKMLGWTIEDLVGRKISILPLEDEEGRIVPLQKQPITRVLAGKIINTKSFYIRNGKTKIPVSIAAAPIKVGGVIVGGVSIFRDISEEKEIDKAKSEFIYIASHGLMTPLSVAKLYLEGLQKKEYFRQAPKTIKEYIEEIYKSNTRCISLVRNLLSVSRIDQGRITDSPEMTNIITMLKKIIKEMQPIAEKNQVSLFLENKEKDIPEIYIDRLHLREVIENLISNAIKYNIPGGKVSVAVGKEIENLLLNVRDTGIGISTKDKSKLFSKFFRTEKASIKNTEGTGLGLYVVKSYVEGWGGKILIESEEGKGSLFSMSIPFKK